MFKLSMQVDVSFGNILLGVAGCSLAVCAYKYCSTKNEDQTENLNREVVNTNDQKQSISAKNDEKGHSPSTLISDEKVDSSNEPSLDENKQKFKPSEADNVNNLEENDATKLRSSEVPDTNSDDSGMNTVDDKDQETNSATPEENQCFPQTETPKIIPSNAKQTGLSESNVEHFAVPSLNVKEDVASSGKSSAEGSATESKQLCSKSETTTPSEAKKWYLLIAV